MFNFLEVSLPHYSKKNFILSSSYIIQYFVVISSSSYSKYGFFRKNKMPIWGTTSLPEVLVAAAQVAVVAAAVLAAATLVAPTTDQMESFPV